MDDALRVGSGERLADLDRRAHRFFHGQGPAAQPSRQRLADEKLHDEEIDPLVMAHLMEGTDARMGEPRDGAGFGDKAHPPARTGCSVRRQNLDRHVAIEPGVAGPVDLAHPSGPDETLDLEHAEAHPTGEKGWGGPRWVVSRLAGANWMAGEKPLGVAMGREQRFHLPAQARIVAALARKKRRPVGFRPGKGRIEERKDVFPAVGRHRG
jgi:hypothetical protein